MLKSINTCMVAKVVGINKIKDGFVDVQPLVNKLDIDYIGLEYPVISYVPIVMPCTSNSAVVLPVKQGDLVLLVFSQNPIDSFKLGSSVEHDPTDLRVFDINDAIAIAGINTTQNNLWKSEKYLSGYNNDSVKVVHNIGKQEENYIELHNDGNISLKATTFNVSCENFNLNASEKVSITSPLISENGV